VFQCVFAVLLALDETETLFLLFLAAEIYFI